MNFKEVTTAKLLYIVIYIFFSRERGEGSAVGWDGRVYFFITSTLIQFNRKINDWILFLSCKHNSNSMCMYSLQVL